MASINYILKLSKLTSTENVSKDEVLRKMETKRALKIRKRHLKLLKQIMRNVGLENLIRRRQERQKESMVLQKESDHPMDLRSV